MPPGQTYSFSSSPTTSPTTSPTRENPATRRLLRAILLFFYIPLLYWSGFALKARAVADYPTYYYGARTAFLEGKSPYGAHALDAYSAELHRGLNPYLAPPPSLLAFWPLVRLPIGSTFILVTILSHVSLLLSIWLILNRLTPLPEGPLARRAFFCMALAYMLIFDAVTATLNLGQTNLIVLALLCLALDAWRNSTSNWRLALPLAAAILLKTYPAALLVLLLLRRRFHAALLTCLCLAAAAGVAAMLLPGPVWAGWWKEVLPAAFVSSDWIPVSFVWNQSLSGFTERLLRDNSLTRAPLLLPSLAQPLANALSLAVFCVTAAVCYFRKQPSPPVPLEDETAAFLLMTYMVAPISWDHHLVFILPAAVLALARIVKDKVRPKTLIGVSAALFLIGWQLPLDFAGVRRSWWNLAISIKLYAVLALWLFFVLRIYRSRGNVEPLAKAPEDNPPVLAPG